MNEEYFLTMWVLMTQHYKDGRFNDKFQAAGDAYCDCRECYHRNNYVPVSILRRLTIQNK